MGNLGIDEGWQIERELVELNAGKKLIGDRKIIAYAYRLKINNLSAISNAIELTEHILVTKDEKIKVKLNKIEPKIELGEMGVL